LQPIFPTMAFYGSSEHGPSFDPRYKGKVKSYNEGDCPNVEEFRKYLCLFNTSMQTRKNVNVPVNALRAMILALCMAVELCPMWNPLYAALAVIGWLSE